MKKPTKIIISALTSAVMLLMPACQSETNQTSNSESGSTSLILNNEATDAFASKSNEKEESMIETPSTSDVSHTDQSSEVSNEETTQKNNSAAENSVEETTECTQNEESSKTEESSDVSVSSEISETKQEYIPLNKEYEHYDKWIWVGDSRTVGMSCCVNITYLAKSAMGLEWFKTVANELYELEGYNIILNFGVNDVHNVLNYADYYNNLPSQIFEKNKVFIMSVNPVDEVKQTEYGYNCSNRTIEWFNENLKANIRNDIEFIDSYNYLTKTGFDTVDGVHYDMNTYIKIYNFMINTITYKQDSETRTE